MSDLSGPPKAGRSTLSHPVARSRADDDDSAQRRCACGQKARPAARVCWVRVGCPNERRYTVSTPARGYTWPPFTEGNEAGRRHGLYSARRAELVAAEVDDLAERVADQYPWTAGYGDERRAYARAFLDERDIRAYLDEHGFLDDDGAERPAVRALERFAARAARCRQVLGLSPMAHAKMLATVSTIVRRHPERTGAPLSDSLDALLSEGRRALERGAQRNQAGEQEP
jgi:hypothetical protein